MFVSGVCVCVCVCDQIDVIKKSEASSDDLCFDESFVAIWGLSKAAKQTMKLKKICARELAQ